MPLSKTSGVSVRGRIEPAHSVGHDDRFTRQPMDNLRKLLSGIPPPQHRKIDTLIRESPSPALARSNLERIIEGGGIKALKKLPLNYFPALFQLIGGSAYLTDILIREGTHWPELFFQQMKIAQKPVSDHLTELSAVLNSNLTAEEFLRHLRRHKQREILRIGARDLSSSQTVEETMRELTSLAEASLQVAYLFSRSLVEKDFGRLRLPGTDRDNGFFILGMGKLGGEELNFSSDIDIIYLYEEDEGESEGGQKGRIGPREFFTRLGELLTRAMGEVTDEGFVFRTDLRLRPLGRHGPLVQSVSSALLYYESWGQCWERSALIKARPVAGNKDLGTQFLHDLKPFVYRRYLDFTTIEELREMKMRIERELLDAQGKERNVKLGRGGIREIEFFTQALQLINGGYQPEIREHSTLRALATLAGLGLISSRDKNNLSQAYCFLRDVEHKLQMVQEGHTHDIPSAEGEERALARRLGYGKADGKSEDALFWKDYRKFTGSVRRAFDGLFYHAQKEMDSESAPALRDIWDHLDEEETVLAQLGELSFSDPDRAYQSLRGVRDGAAFSPPSPRRIKVMRTLGPSLMTEILKSGAPEQALFNLSEFIQRVGARTGFLSLLAENPKTTHLLINLFANSQFLTDLFLKRPELLDSLIRVDLTRLDKTKRDMLDDFAATLVGRNDLEDKLNALRRYRAEEFIRIGLHDFGKELELGNVLEQLSALADACLEAALTLSLQEWEKSYGKVPKGRFAVLSMGKLGGEEIDYHSDLDLIFIYDAPEDARSAGGQSGSLENNEYYLRLGQKLLTFLSAPMEEGVAYNIDMRLRPSGRFGPLVSSLEGFRVYHQTSAELWERQALTKLRASAGDHALGAEAEAIAENFAYGKGLTQDEIAAIDHLRMRMEKELAQENDSRFNLKKGKGGLVDIEFLAQRLQLTHGHRYPGIRKRKTLQALRSLMEHKLLKKNEYHLLSNGYLFLRRLDHRLRLERDQSVDILEREPEKLQRIARALGYTGRDHERSGSLLLRDYEQWRQRIRSCYESFFEATKTEGGKRTEIAGTPQ